MRYLALATDYDGTIAHHGKVDTPTLDALKLLVESGRKLILVTGRELPDLVEVSPDLSIFHRVVAENGALLYIPETREERVLAEAPPKNFVDELLRRNVPISQGKSIVATWEPHEKTVLEVIRELGLELQVIFNKGAVMVLPSGVNKGTGLAAALVDLRLSHHNVVGVGDAENDHAFLSTCECAVATANAIETLKARADFVTKRHHGAGVAELIDDLLGDDLASFETKLQRHLVLLGNMVGNHSERPVPANEDQTENELKIRPYGTSVLVAGPSGSGKSTAVTGLLERLQEAEYQFCLVDPEGDYEAFPGSVCIGNAQHAPTATEVLELLEHYNNTVVNLLGVKLNDRPGFFAQLIPGIQEMRARTGRPHWIAIDEAHHLLPANWSPAAFTYPKNFGGMLLVTVHPEMVAPEVISEVNVVLAVGKNSEKTFSAFSRIANVRIPLQRDLHLESGEVLAFIKPQDDEKPVAPVRVRVKPARIERLRHRRKYATGDVQEKSFHFRGPDDKLNLRAQNLNIFSQIAEGVDDETWLHHLRQGDYSQWVREAIKDQELADEIAKVETGSDHSAETTRRLVMEAIDRRYTGAA